MFGHPCDIRKSTGTVVQPVGPIVGTSCELILCFIGRRAASVGQPSLLPYKIENPGPQHHFTARTKHQTPLIMHRKILIGFGVDVDAVAGWYAESNMHSYWITGHTDHIGLGLTEERTPLQTSREYVSLHVI